MRDSASYCRPRLYDEDDPEREDDVRLIIDALDEVIDRAMEAGNRDLVSHATDLRRRVIRSAGGAYSDNPELEAEADDR